MAKTPHEIITKLLQDWKIDHASSRARHIIGQLVYAGFALDFVGDDMAQRLFEERVHYS